MVNYQNSQIYKLCCKDPSIKDIYVGSTTNFRTRKNCHKRTCTNENNKGYNTPVYQFIRENGGWENWDMIEVEKYSAKDKNDLHKRERFWLEELSATLNKKIPSQQKSEYRQNNKEKISQYDKEYYQNNKEKAKEYYQNNKEKISQREAEWRQKNREKLAEKVSCECGSIVTRANLTRHQKSIKHIMFVNKNK